MSEFSPNYGMGIAMDLDYPIFIWHDGHPKADGTVITDAHIDVTTPDTSFTLYITTAGSSAADSRLGSSGVLTKTAYATWGLLMREINSVVGWHAVLRDAHFDGITDPMTLPTAKTSCFQKSVGISIDNSDDFQMGVGIVNFEAGTSMEGVQACIYHVTGQITSTQGSPLCQIYDCDDDAGTEQLIHQFILTTATEYAFPIYGPNSKPFYVAKPGHRILVLYEGVDNLTAGRAEVIGGLREVD